MAAAPSRGLVGLFKRGWNEIPEVVGSCILGFVGIGITTGAVYLYYKKDGDNRRYKTVYTVIRHDDPKAAKVRTD
ncbi:uncharacterized protein LOC108907881 [Anoplophora glabripennis]|uniref:uncharacterized protein LOC108907881 n=1 Tax=Anoplophora glabripennis TaxID=217634 RepID=UPI00087580E0|nr:uncharacterized protein LOC108907881 [Anoplophora glabripennis]XP_023309945.1 uncharacterized protein LOC108907881 [Anoplophora glabripennis]XP_023309946.1 uncharacterized protein LOC108907881 [Anoplophora glabripennis]